MAKATRANGAATTAAGSVVAFPRESIYELQRSAQGVELLAFLAPPDGCVSDKRLSKFVEVATHPRRPWIATLEPRGSGVVWDSETREVVREFSLEVSLDGDSAGDDDAAASAPATASAAAAVAVGAKSSSLLPKGSSSPTAYMRSSKSKSAAGALAMLFYDHEAIANATQSTSDRSCFDEWIVVLTGSHVVMCDLNQSSAIRSVTPDDLHRQAPCSVEILPSGLLAIGCQDGKIRVWSPQLWRVVDTIDTGSSKDVQQLLFLPSQTLSASRSGSGSSATSSSIRANYAAQHLVATTLDGKVVAWRVAVASGESFECKKVSEVELKEAHKPFDATSGVCELKLHEHQEMMSAATKDGTVFFFDLAPLFRQAKSLTLVGILPTNKLPGARVVPGPRKASFVVTISELANKGRLVGKDNVATSFHEFAVGASSESRDFKHFVGETPSALAKKLKILSLTSSRRDASELCALTTFGLLVFRTCCVPDAKPAFIARGAGKAPLLAYPSAGKVALRFFGEETSPKQEDCKLQSSGDAPNEKLKTPLLLSCPSNASYLAAVLPIGTHFEILHMDSELRNQKTIAMSSVFSGNAIALAWHASQTRFAVLVPQDVNSRRTARSQTSAHITPRRRGFMFGGSSKNVGDDPTGAEARLRNQQARLMTLSVFEISKETGQVEMVEESCAGADDRLLHIFSGPLLGVAKFDTGELGGAGDGGSSKSLTDSPRHDSPSSMMRSKRTESSVFSAISSPSFASSSSNATTDSSSLSEVDTSDITRSYLEFYEWGSVGETSAQSSRRLGDTLRKIGSAIECPLAVEWESVTHRFCALVYPQSVKIFRATAAPPDVVCLHEIPTCQPALSLKWFHHTLFFSTADEVKCCVVSKSRCFTFDLASSLPRDESLGRSAGTDAADDFPTPQRVPSGATTILGVHNAQLLLAAPVQAVHALDLSNRVLQCCMLISLGKEELALQVAEALNPELCDWLGTVFEAFGCLQQALRLSRLSPELKMNICIKHNLLMELEQLLATPGSDSLDTAGTSLFQRGCVCLRRGSRDAQALKSVFEFVLASGRFSDAAFVATLLQDHELLVRAHAAREDWRAAHHAARRSTEAKAAFVDKWNADIQNPTSSWRTMLERQHIRAPETITLAPSAR